VNKPKGVSAGDVRRADNVQKLIKLLPKPKSKKNQRAIITKLKAFQHKISAEKLLAAREAEETKSDNASEPAPATVG
jgi:hypothetical protein